MSSRSQRRSAGLKRSRDFKRLIRAINEGADNAFAEVTESVAQQVLFHQLRLVPVGQGDLRRALSKKVSKTGLNARIGLVTKKRQQDFFYARFLEYGTKGYSGLVRPGLASNRSPYYVTIPPQAPRPFLRPAFELNRESFIKELDEAFLKAVDKLTRNSRGKRK